MGHVMDALARLKGMATAGSLPDDVVREAEVIAAGWWWWPRTRCHGPEPCPPDHVAVSDLRGANPNLARSGKPTLADRFGSKPVGLGVRTGVLGDLAHCHQGPCRIRPGHGRNATDPHHANLACPREQPGQVLRLVCS